MTTSILMDERHAEVLNQHIPLRFYWPDCQHSCRHFMQKLSSHDKGLQEKLLAVENKMKQLKETAIWIKNEEAVICTSMYELYREFIHLRSYQRHEKDQLIGEGVSFVSASGPYKKMSVGECFNLDDYEMFVMVLMMEGKLHLRDFRLRLNTPLILEYGDHLQDVAVIDFQQITTTGLLFKSTEASFLKKMKKKFSASFAHRCLSSYRRAT